MATTHNTVTVKLRLDLGELITQLRNLADTLEATQTPKAAFAPDPVASCVCREPACACPKTDPDGCTHEAWDVHPNGITRRCSDCRATLPDLEPGTCHCGAKPNEVHNPLFAHPERVTVSEVFTSLDGLARKVPGGPDDFPCCATEGIRDLNSEAAGKLSDEALAALRCKLGGQPEPSHFTDGTKPARNPHTLDLPEGMDPAEAEHILRVTDDALKSRTQPIMFFAGGTLSSHGLVATLNQPAPDLGVDSHGLRCTRCEHPYHRRSICPACGCDPRRADHGADPR